jgi:hypothetical protein
MNMVPSPNTLHADGPAVGAANKVHFEIGEDPAGVAACFAFRLDSIGVCDSRDEHSGAYLARLLDAQVDFIAALPGVGKGSAVELRYVAHPDLQARHCGRVEVLLRVRTAGATMNEALARARSTYQGLHPNLVAMEETYEWVPVRDGEEYQTLFDVSRHTDFGNLLRREAQIRLAAIDPLPRNRPIGFAMAAPEIDGPDPEAVHVFAPFIPTLADLTRLFDVLLLQPARTVLSITLAPTTLRAGELDYLLLQAGRCEHFLATDAPRALPQKRQLGLLIQQFTDAVFSLRDDCFDLDIQIAGCGPLSGSLVEAFGTSVTGHVSAMDALNGSAPQALMKGGFDWTLAASEEERDQARAHLMAMTPLPRRQDQGGRLRHLFSAREANCAFRFPLPRANDFPGLPTRHSVVLPPPLSSPNRGLLLGENFHRGIQHPIQTLMDDRRRHTYIVGQTGTGKSTLLRSMILQDVEAGRGVAVLDPHGELVDEILACIPAHRVKDVHYISPERMDLSIGINMLEHRDEMERDLVINNLLEIFQRLYSEIPESMGPAFEQYFRNAALLEMAFPVDPPTLDGLLRIFSDPDYRNRRMQTCSDPIVKSFWTLALRTTGDTSLANMGQWVVNKLSRFLYNGMLRRILLQPKTTIDFQAVLDRGGILLVDLCKGKLGEMNTAFLAMALIGQIQRAAFARTGVYDKSQLRDFYLYIDEFQNVATRSFITILSEARKYRLNAILTNQYMHQIPQDIIEAVRGNVGTTIAFRTGFKDAELLSEEFAPTIRRDDLLSLPNFHAYVRTLVRGEATQAFSLRTHNPRLERNQDSIDQILRGMSRYSTASHRVEAMIMERWAPEIVLDL